MDETGSPGPRKVRPARIAGEAPVPEGVREPLARMADRYGVRREELEERFRRFEGYDLVRERFRGRPERERWDYILLILEERLQDER